MSIKMVKGNLLDSDCEFICHQVNCQGAMNSGIAKQIRERWPIVYNNYITKFSACQSSADLLGDIQIVALYDDFYKTEKHQYVINLFAQQYYGYDGKRYTSYDAFWYCLNLIKNTIPKGKKIGFPYKIGSDRGGANWQIIFIMISEVLGKDYEIEIYQLGE